MPAFTPRSTSCTKFFIRVHYTFVVNFMRVVVAASRRILLRGSRTHAENKHRLRKCPRDVRTRRCCSGHLRKLRKILKCRHLVLTFHAMALFPASGLAPAPMNMRVHRQKRSLQSQEEGSISSSSFRTRAQLLRPRLRSPARRRNSSAEWPGPSNGTSMKRVSSCAIASSTPTALQLPQSQLRRHVRKLLL